MDLISLIISAVSLIVGIISFIITIMTWKNTKDIAKNVDASKIKQKYPKRHPEYLKAFETAQVSLSDGGHKYYIISELLKNCKNIQAFYDNWDHEQKKVIDKFAKELENIPVCEDIDEKTRAKLQKELFKIYPMMERIGALNDIG